MAIIEIPFGEWLPDLPARNNPGATEARNVTPEALSYRPFRAAVPFTSAAAERVLHAFWAQDSSNTVYNFAGGASALYQLDAAGAWNDVTRTVGGAYAATDWQFAKFGDRVIAVAGGGNAPQYFDLGTSTNFEDLPGSPPNAARIAVVRDFVVLGGLDADPANIHWSGFFNSEIWSTTPEQTAQTQSDSQEIFGRGGRVQALVGGEDGYVFLEHSIVRLRYEGPPRFFILQEAHTQRGTPAPNSVARTGDSIFFYAHDGFWKMSAGSGQLQAIGQNKVNRWFAETCDPSTIRYMRGAIDRRNQLMVWAFSSSGNIAAYDRLLIYNWASDRWAYAVVNTEALVDLASVGYNLDTLDTLLTNGIDIDSFPVDSPVFTGGELNLTPFSTAHAAAAFAGSPLVAMVDTKELNDAALSEQVFGRRILVRGARPLVSAGGAAAVSVQFGTRDSLNDATAWSAATALNGIGMADRLTDARYHRFRVTVDGEFDHMLGCEVDLRLSGKV